MVTCRARGVFRKRGLTPLVGDFVRIEAEEEEVASISEILPRKNALIRPPVANLDQLFLVVSTASPEPNLLVLDKLIAVAEHKGIEPIIVITKNDLRDGGELAALYRRAGFTVFCHTQGSRDDVDAIAAQMRGRLSAFCGNSGAGKTTLLNALDPTRERRTGEISDKLGRGRHTTREVEIFALPEGGEIADTPGFSSLEGLLLEEVILKDDLPLCFRDFAAYREDCRFTGCSHTKEKGCAVLEAVHAGEVAASRHENYCQMFEEVRNIKEWELKK